MITRRQAVIGSIAIILFVAIGCFTMEFFFRDNTPKTPDGYSLVTEMIEVEYGDTIWDIAGNLRKEYPAMKSLSTTEISDWIGRINPGMSMNWIHPGVAINVPVWVERGEEKNYSFQGEVVFNH